MVEIDSYNTEEIVCPWCGFVFGDSWEYNEQDDLVKCPECDKTMELEIEHSVTYFTKKPDWLRQWRKWNRKQISDRLCRIQSQEIHRNNDTRQH